MEQKHNCNFWCLTDDRISCPRGQIVMATHEGYEIFEPVITQGHSMPPSILPTWTWSCRKPHERQTWTQLTGKPVDERPIALDRSLRENRDRSERQARSRRLTVVSCDVTCQTEPERCQKETIPEAAKMICGQFKPPLKIRDDTTLAIPDACKPTDKPHVQKTKCQRKPKMKDCTEKQNRGKTRDENSRPTNRLKTGWQRHMWKQLRIEKIKPNIQKTEEMKPHGSIQKGGKLSVALPKGAKSFKINWGIEAGPNTPNPIIGDLVRGIEVNNRKRPRTVDKQDYHKRLKYDKEANEKIQDLDDLIKQMKIPRKLAPISNKQNRKSSNGCEKKFHPSKARNFKRPAKGQPAAASDDENETCETIKTNEDETNEKTLKTQICQAHKCRCKSKSSVSSGHPRLEFSWSSRNVAFRPKEREQSSPQTNSSQLSICQQCGKQKRQLPIDECYDEFRLQKENNNMPQKQRSLSRIRIHQKCGENTRVDCDKDFRVKKENNNMPQKQRSLSVVRMCQKSGKNTKVDSDRIHSNSCQKDMRENNWRRICSSCSIPDKLLTPHENESHKKKVTFQNEYDETRNSNKYENNFTVKTEDSNKCMHSHSRCMTNRENNRDLPLNEDEPIESIESNFEQTNEKMSKHVVDRKNSDKHKVQDNKSFVKETRLLALNNERAQSEENTNTSSSKEASDSDDDKYKRNTDCEEFELQGKKCFNNINLLYDIQKESEETDVTSEENKCETSSEDKESDEIGNQNPNNKDKINSNIIVVPTIDVQALVTKYQEKLKDEEINGGKEDDKFSNIKTTKLINKGKCMRKMGEMKFDKKFFGIVSKTELGETKNRNTFSQKELNKRMNNTYSDHVWNIYNAFMEGDRKVFNKHILGADDRRNVSLETKNIKLSKKVIRNMKEVPMPRQHWEKKTNEGRTKTQGDGLDNIQGGKSEVKGSTKQIHSLQGTMEKESSNTKVPEYTENNTLEETDIKLKEGSREGNFQVEKCSLELQGYIEQALIQETYSKKELIGGNIQGKIKNDYTKIEDVIRHNIQQVEECIKNKKDQQKLERSEVKNISRKQEQRNSSMTEMEKFNEMIVKKRRERLNTLDQLGKTIENIFTLMHTLSPKPSANTPNGTKYRQVSNHEIISSFNYDKSDNLTIGNTCDPPNDLVSSKSSDPLNVLVKDNSCNIANNNIDSREDLFKMFINSTPFVEFRKGIQTYFSRSSIDSFINNTDTKDTINESAGKMDIMETLNDEMTDVKETELHVINTDN